ncbi:2-oxoglutarate dehydrogenase complex dihydrolipoyllysine-residue succinyltransferase [Arachidicoccus soli]|uniref:Dihydrolipoyllysine-residue succinyltransferase component of 2-oxoglutarate dehydrogenase complex n=1 Tax=Arachidicoccus soli TaxID=2341117 RepID=A0A386HL51_9BACT|nr:2-oxoglutarate dehydrogenase complex dihydrolipoyllysine-residue succinyltransferase [Arachidicoccus soli]AYD46628.1 2-oxoglutarate dehydrogenase complex dihydrolipoyllysine-residue succinyltransferase [Arachidicoccus soli]
MIEIKVPTVGESISEVTLIKWVKNNGEYVNRDEVIAELESEKATFEVNAEQAGILHAVAEVDATLQIGDVLATIDETASKPLESNNQKTIETKQETDTIAPSPITQPKATGRGIIEIKVPTVGESISEVTLVRWIKHEGDLVNRDEPIAELESEKATFELNAEEAGKLSIIAKEDDVLQIGDLVAKINTDIAVPIETTSPKGATETSTTKTTETTAPVISVPIDIKATPLASAMIADKKVDTKSIKASGEGGKILKADVLAALANPGKQTFAGAELFSRNERREKMSNLRKTISRRLVESKNTTAMLTTFNEVDMSNIMDIRKKYKDKFKEQHGVGLGFMSFFSKACAIALAEWPAVNAYIDGNELVYHDYADISIAVSTPKGLTVPVMRNVESKSMADIEKNVIELATKARNGKLGMEDLQGGTFTITNGGTFGSLLSTPIINLPQSAILGMHKIQDRPMAVNGQVVICPMMYIALSYDHRIIDGKESVSFLVRVKELLENPELLLFSKNPIQALLEL